MGRRCEILYADTNKVRASLSHALMVSGWWLPRGGSSALQLRSWRSAKRGSGIWKHSIVNKLRVNVAVLQVLRLSLSHIEFSTLSRNKVRKLYFYNYVLWFNPLSFFLVIDFVGFSVAKRENQNYIQYQPYINLFKYKVNFLRNQKWWGIQGAVTKWDELWRRSKRVQIPVVLFWSKIWTPLIPTSVV